MIQVLDQDTANKIAAGEVVERPASVVKELVENSLDANASEISVEVLNGGLSFIRVRDNGKGISKEELPLAIKRHATSKITKAEDLTHIETLGFRGEALPSIAAVSRFSIKSAKEGEPGSEILVLGGEYKGLTPTAMSKGTIVEIEDLFYNVPARRKFLRSQNAESGRIQRFLEAIAICRPDIAITYLSDGKKIIDTHGTGSMLMAIRAIYGEKLSDHLLEIKHQLGDYYISGYVGKPDISRGRRDQQIFILNGRLVECRTVQAALEKAFYDVSPKGRYPIAFLNLKLPLEEVDVNVHPAKLIVRLSSENQVFSLVYKAVRNVIDTRLLEPASFMEPFGTKQMKHRPIESTSLNNQKTIEWVTNREEEPKENAQSLLNYRTEEAATLVTPSFLNKEDKSELPLLIKDNIIEYHESTPRILGQVNKTYIIAEWTDCVIMYDQHSAHERILFEKYLLANENLPKTELLFPLPLNLNPDDYEALDRIRDQLVILGFGIEEFGPASLAVTHVPSDVLGSEAEEIIRELLLERPGAHFRERAAAILSCKGAIKAGSLLDLKQMSSLIKELHKCKTPALCPHGRPTMLRLDWNEMEKRFGRNR